MKKNLPRKYINTLLILGVSFMIILSATSFFQMKKLGEANSWVIHSHKVIEITNDVLVWVNYAESTVRGYFLTGNTQFLDHYFVAIKSIESNLFVLQHLVSGSQDQNKRVADFARIINIRTDDLSHKISLYQQGGLDKVRRDTKQGNGENLGKQIRDLATKINDTESNILQLRNRNVIDHYFLINVLILFCSVSSLGLILLGIVLLNQQITFRHKAEKELQQSEDELFNLAYFDPLTGLANRALLYTTIENAIDSASASNQGIALLYLDLDNFKNINDSLGHDVGDSLLKVIAKLLKQVVGHAGIVSRIGGDEFIVLLTHVEKTDSITVIAHRLLSALAKPSAINNHKLFITTSIGISVYPLNGKTPHVLMKNADIALYRAKELGRNNYQYCLPELTQKVEERAQLDHHLRQAVLNQEFSLLYQPIVSLQNEEVIGVEALIRWNKPHVGIVYPADFIMHAESNGLIVPIGEWLLHKACEEANQWQKIRGFPIKIAINVSTRQFILNDFVTSVTNVLNETKFDPHCLELEITESVLLENTDNNLAALRELKELGVQITIDDFGTGYSSLSYLRYFSIDKLKIDKSFIREINSMNHNSIIIKAIITMAHSLNIKVTAEGVETAAQVDFLKALNCDEAQGYYFSHPLSANEFQAYVKKELA